MPTFEGVDCSMVPHYLRHAARGHIKKRDSEGLLCLIGNHESGKFVYDNEEALRSVGMFEQCLLVAYCMGTLHSDDWYFLFSRADREKLILAGDPNPKTGKKCKLYRGVYQGEPGDDHEAGFSWTASLDMACWFALRLGKGKPRIVSAWFPTNWIWAYLGDEHGRGEDEFLILGDPEFPEVEQVRCRVRPHEISPAEMVRRHDRQRAAILKHNTGGMLTMP